MSSNTSKFMSDLPPWAKGVIAMAGIAAVGLSAYLIYRKVKNLQAEKNSKKEVSAIDSDLKILQKGGGKITLTKSDIAGIANNLFVAMDGYGSNYDMILKNMVKVNNQLDLLAVIKEYGVREISSGRLNPEPNFKGTLGQALAEELDSKQMNALNLMLAKKGIKQRF